MLSRLLYRLQAGWQRVRANSRLWLVVAFLLLFPLLFIAVVEQFYRGAATAVETAEQERMGMLQDVLSARLQYEPADTLPQLLAHVIDSNPDVPAVRIYQEVSPQEVTVMAAAGTEPGTTTMAMPGLFIAAKAQPGVPVSTQSKTAYTGRVVQVATYVTHNDASYLLYAEHARGLFDQALQARKQTAYLLLSVVLLVLIAVAVWVSRQTDWQRRHQTLATQVAERDLFTNMIAHEFRTPLTAIKGYAGLLQESSTVTADDRRYADVIRESSERLVLLVNDFLEVARIQSGRMQLDFVEVDARAIIKDVFTALQPKAAEKQLQLVYTPSLQAQLITTDRNRCIQVLTNIISNSIKYTDKGVVEISAEEDRRGLTIRIKDTGVGISAEDQQKLFAPFSRVGAADDTATTGTGLGMWITKQLIELLGGSIMVESIKGVGTHVVLHLARQR